MSIPAELSAALRHLRAVRALKPDDDHGEPFAAWRISMAEALEVLSLVLLFEENRTQARASAAKARAEAEEIRRRLV